MEFVGKSCCAVAFYGRNARIAFKHSDKLGNCFLGSFSCFVLLGINSKQVFFNFLMRFVQNAQISCGGVAFRNCRNRRPGCKHQHRKKNDDDFVQPLFFVFSSCKLNISESMYCSLISLSGVVDRYSVEPVQTDSPFNERSCSNPTDSTSLRMTRTA